MSSFQTVRILAAAWIEIINDTILIDLDLYRKLQRFLSMAYNMPPTRVANQRMVSYSGHDVSYYNQI